MNEHQLLTLESVYGIFCDAWVDDEEMLVFASFWGRDTACQSLPNNFHQSTSKSFQLT